MYYPSSENKGADQLRGYREADLRLCFRKCRLLVFPRDGSNGIIVVSKVAKGIFLMFYSFYDGVSVLTFVCFSLFLPVKLCIPFGVWKAIGQVKIKSTIALFL